VAIMFRAGALLAMWAHMAIILFMAIGGLFTLWWPGVVWVQVPAFLYAGAIGIWGWRCPLTELENYCRRQAGQNIDRFDFVEHYIMPVLYPHFLFPNGFPKYAFGLLCLLLVMLNIIIYGGLYLL